MYFQYVGQLGRRINFDLNNGVTVQDEGPTGVEENLNNLHPDEAGTPAAEDIVAVPAQLVVPDEKPAETLIDGTNGNAQVLNQAMNGTAVADNGEGNVTTAGPSQKKAKRAVPPRKLGNLSTTTVTTRRGTARQAENRSAATAPAVAVDVVLEAVPNKNVTKDVPADATELVNDAVPAHATNIVDEVAPVEADARGALPSAGTEPEAAGDAIIPPEPDHMETPLVPAVEAPIPAPVVAQAASADEDGGNSLGFEVTRETQESENVFVNSETGVYSEHAVYPMLNDCTHPVRNVIDDMTHHTM